METFSINYYEEREKIELQCQRFAYYPKNKIILLWNYNHRHCANYVCVCVCVCYSTLLNKRYYGKINFVITLLLCITHTHSDTLTDVKNLHQKAAAVAAAASVEEHCRSSR